MAEVTSIQPADLRKIEHNLSAIHQKIQVVDEKVEVVGSSVSVVYDEVESLAREFHEFVDNQERANRLGQAETRLVRIRQELEQRYGHYDMVRRMATGILQADDLAIVRQETISTMTEEVMVSTPNYWLAPCLVALAAWINDQPGMAERALREGIRRNDEKTSLFFALVCRRADRKNACLKWTQRYLANQDEEKLDRKAIIIIDAFASGLLGADSEGMISRQMAEWLERLAEKPGFIEQQTKQWSDAINLKRKPVDLDSYTYLRKYTKTWPELQKVMEGACLHAELLAYFMAIFEQEPVNKALKEQLDEILTSLVTDFDEEEIPLRKEERFEQFVVDLKGDEKRAKQDMEIEQTAFEEEKDFTQLLTDASMKPESSNASVSTQKFAISLSKEWIYNAYQDIVAQNRMKIPHEIELQVGEFSGTTLDGQDEKSLLTRFNQLIDAQIQAAIAGEVLTGFQKFCLAGGAAVALLGVLMLFGAYQVMGVIAIIAGIGMIVYYHSSKNQVEVNQQKIRIELEAKRKNDSKIIRAVLAEVVDFREEFARKDGESEQVSDFLEQLSPDQYISRLSDSTRRIRV